MDNHATGVANLLGPGFFQLSTFDQTKPSQI